MINTEYLDSVFRDCLFREDESTDIAVIVDGITGQFGFHPDRLKSHRQEIYSMLMQLPHQFRVSDEAQGWSFMQMPFDNDGEQWGEHPNAQQLMVLAVAMGFMRYLMPKDLWAILPGGMPYVAFDDGVAV
jgi:hypothetical protein